MADCLTETSDSNRREPSPRMRFARQESRPWEGKRGEGGKGPPKGGSFALVCLNHCLLDMLNIFVCAYVYFVVLSCRRELC